MINITITIIINFQFFDPQTHISENKEEVKAVEAVFSDYSSYAGVYDAANLLTNKVINKFRDARDGTRFVPIPV